MSQIIRTIKINGLTINIVKDEVCPICGELGRTKVHDGIIQWWKCYNRNCPVGYYAPETNQIDVSEDKIRAVTNPDLIHANIVKYNKYPASLK